MTSPFSSSLLQQPVDETREAPRHERSVTRVVAAPQPVYAPQPAYAPQPTYVAVPSGGGNAVTTILLGLLVVLLGAVALAAGYYATAQAQPSDREARVEQGIAMRDGFRAGRERGIAQGRTQALDFASTTTALRAATARQQAYAAAFKRGERAGRRSYRPARYTGGRGSGYRGPRFGGFGNGDVYSALGQAQHIANMTGAPVDVEVY